LQRRRQNRRAVKLITGANIALTGHATLIETRTRGAVKEFALIAQIHNRLHMIMAEQERVEDFWNHYADDGQSMRLACRELLLN
jgi:hypothetical protein